MFSGKYGSFVNVPRKEGLFGECFQDSKVLL